MKYITSILLCFTLFGCGSIPEPDLEAVANFKPHDLNAGDDTGVYLIRPNQFAGGGRDYWVAVDNKVIGDLENGTYVFMSLNSKNNNSINTVVSMAGQNYIAIPETVGDKSYHFYSVDFTTWIPKKLSPEVGKTLVTSMKEHTLDLKVRPNDAYDNLAMNPSMVASYMENTTEQLSPTNEYGVLYFFRPSSTEKVMSLPASVWSQDAHLGSLEPKQYFAVKVPVGEYDLYRRDGKFHKLTLNVEPNKYHYIELRQSFSFTGYNHSLEFIGKEESISNSKVRGWLKSLTQQVPTSRDTWSGKQKKYVELGLEYLNANKESFDTPNQ